MCKAHDTLTTIWYKIFVKMTLC